jgi:hypothetical protein
MSRLISQHAHSRTSKLVMRVRFPSPAPTEFPQFRPAFGAAILQDQEVSERRRARNVPDGCLSVFCFAAASESRLADRFAALPGGLCTLDELIEILT